MNNNNKIINIYNKLINENIAHIFFKDIIENYNKKENINQIIELLIENKYILNDKLFKSLNKKNIFLNELITPDEKYENISNNFLFKIMDLYYFYDSKNEIINRIEYELKIGNRNTKSLKYVKNFFIDILYYQTLLFNFKKYMRIKNIHQNIINENINNYKDLLNEYNFYKYFNSLFEIKVSTFLKRKDIYTKNTNTIIIEYSNSYYHRYNSLIMFIEEYNQLNESRMSQIDFLKNILKERYELLKYYEDDIEISENKLSYIENNIKKIFKSISYTYELFENIQKDSFNEENMIDVIKNSDELKKYIFLIDDIIYNIINQIIILNIENNNINENIKKISKNRENMKIMYRGNVITNENMKNKKIGKFLLPFSQKNRVNIKLYINKLKKLYTNNVIKKIANNNGIKNINYKKIEEFFNQEKNEVNKIERKNFENNLKNIYIKKLINNYKFKNYLKQIKNTMSNENKKSLKNLLYILKNNTSKVNLNSKSINQLKQMYSNIELENIENNTRKKIYNPNVFFNFKK